MAEIRVSEDEIVKARREYYRNWRANNKDKVRQHNKNYWTKKAAEKQQTEKSGKIK